MRWETDRHGLESRLNGVLLDRYGKDEKAGYPTLCKGRFEVGGETYYAIEEPTSLNTLDLLPEMLRWASPRSRSKAASAARPTWRRSPRSGAPPSTPSNECRELHRQPAWQAELNKVAEGQQHTLGAYHRPWK